MIKTKASGWKKYYKMKKIFSVIGFILSGLVLYTAGDDHGENSISYDKESFEKVVNEKKQFVMFFAPW